VVLLGLRLGKLEFALLDDVFIERQQHLPDWGYGRMRAGKYS
jgi:hypothetical protein